MEQYRKSPRHPWIDYDVGLYFVTICTHHMVHYFGEVIDKEMQLSEIGKIVELQLKVASSKCRGVEVPMFVVMPNHIHMVVDCGVGESVNISMNHRSPNPMFRGASSISRHVPKLSRFISSFKGSVTKLARTIAPDFQWQARYHDHLIRNQYDGSKIARYILTNPTPWDKDCFFD